MTGQRTKCKYQIIAGVKTSEDGRIRVYKTYRGFWTVEVDNSVIGHYRCPLFYALLTAEQYLRTGDATQVPEPLPPMDILPYHKQLEKNFSRPVRISRVEENASIAYNDSELLKFAIHRSRNAIGSLTTIVDEGTEKTIRALEFPVYDVPDDMPGACQPWKPSRNG